MGLRDAEIQRFRVLRASRSALSDAAAAQDRKFRGRSSIFDVNVHGRLCVALRAGGGGGVT